MERITLSVGGAAREYLLFVPPGEPSPRPLVVFLHGAGGTAEWADGETGWSALAGREGFALALPEGTPPHPDKPPKFLTNPRRWNDGSPSPVGDADDVAFLAAVVDDATHRTPIDANRIYLSGFSNGAGMTFRAAAGLDRFAAVAPVAGLCWVAGPRLVRPVPTLYLVGSSDPLIPLRGGDVRSPWLHRIVRRPPVADSLERWAAGLGCDVIPRVESDADGVRVEVYPGPVEFRSVVIDGLGHHWPGGKGRLTEKIGGKPSDKLDATAEVWRFFHRHSRA
ncbi:MAG TPA: PHB depolymerase family esterase [Gemmataceae bacterium]|nr:PHB depolymerase family esterase [Gemmataceae bacterium]